MRAGYGTLDFLQDIEKADEFDDINASMPIGHRRRILKRLRVRAGTPAVPSEPIRKRPRTDFAPQTAPSPTPGCHFRNGAPGGPAVGGAVARKAAPVANPPVASRSVENSSVKTTQVSDATAMPSSPARRTKTNAMCSDWMLSGTCADGDKCDFAHEGTGGLGAGGPCRELVAAISADIGPMPGESKRGVCFQWQKTMTCQFGARCKYLHEGNGAGGAPEPPPAPQKNHKIFVGGVPGGVDEQHLARVFSQFGEVAVVWIKIDDRTRKSKGFGFVTFASAEGAQRALQNTVEIRGKKLDCKMAIDKYTTSSIVCWNCSEKGHTAHNCPHKSVEIVCWHCSERGHTEQKCPYKDSEYGQFPGQ